LLEVEVIGDGGPDAPPPREVQRLVGLALASAGVGDGHVAVEPGPLPEPRRAAIQLSAGQEPHELDRGHVDRLPPGSLAHRGDRGLDPGPGEVDEVHRHLHQSA